MGDLDDADKTHLRRAIALAHAAVDRGNRPFGSVLTDGRGQVIAEGYSTQVEDGDWTAHAEMQVLRAAGKKLSWDELAGGTIYASGEPCPMCAAAVHWCNVRRLVFGLDEVAMRDFRRFHAQGAGLEMSCRDVLSRSPRSIEVIGPALIKEATAPHTRFWKPPA
jgi:tRNA(Arg) A34 adenosine deaminase TadA